MSLAMEYSVLYKRIATLKLSLYFCRTVLKMADLFLNNQYWVQKMKARFSYFDTDKDGALSIEDFQLLADNLVRCGDLKEPKSASVRERVMKLWSLFGKAEGGKITEEEWITTMAGMSSTDVICNLGNAYFDTIDSDEDGVISVKELTVLFEAVGGNRADAPGSFDALDDDKDGRLSRDEFMKYFIECARGTDENSKGHHIFGLSF